MNIIQWSAVKRSLTKFISLLLLTFTSRSYVIWIFVFSCFIVCHHFMFTFLCWNGLSDCQNTESVLVERRWTRNQGLLLDSIFSVFLQFENFPNTNHFTDCIVLGICYDGTIIRGIVLFLWPIILHILLGICYHSRVLVRLLRPWQH